MNGCLLVITGVAIGYFGALVFDTFLIQPVVRWTRKRTRP